MDINVHYNLIHTGIPVILSFSFLRPCLVFLHSMHHCLSISYICFIFCYLTPCIGKNSLSLLYVSFTFTQNTSLLTISVTKCMEVCSLYPAKQFSVTPASCPTIQLNFDTPWRCIRSPRIRLPPHHTLRTAITSSRSPGYPQLLSIWLQVRDSYDLPPALNSIIC